MEEDKDNWGGYSKLVLKELERLNENYDKMRTDIDHKFGDLNVKISEIRRIEKDVADTANWIEKVNDVWSPNQMSKAKDEIYRQQNRWTAAIAVLSFIQILMGIAIAVWGKFR